MVPKKITYDEYKKILQEEKDNNADLFWKGINKNSGLFHNWPLSSQVFAPLKYVQAICALQQNLKQ
jgi:hypothetical protein